MDEFAFKPEKQEEDKKEKKSINFVEMPKEAETILGQDAQKQIVTHFTQQTPMAMPIDANPNPSHLSLILSPNLREVELMIRGLEYYRQYNPITQRDEVVLKKIENHPLNEYGVTKIMELLKIWSSSELKLGRRLPKDAMESAQQIGTDAKRLIYKNLAKFGMDTQTKQRSAKTYVLAIFEFSYSALTRSIHGSENDASRPTEYSIQSNMLESPEINRTLSKEKKESFKN